MRIADMNWMQVRDHVGKDDRAVLPVGSTEQHAYLSLAVDSILSERVALEAADPLGIPVFPVINYGLTPSFVAYPGTVTLKISTLCALLGDVLDGMVRSGFRRIVIVNGHGGNTPAHGAVLEWLDRNHGCQVKWHNWWNAPKTWAKAMEIDPVASHASWLENFPWTRLAGAAAPAGAKPVPDLALMRASSPDDVRTILGDGSFGGEYAKPDDIMLELWRAGVEEVREALEGPWPSRS